jgi:hypothetical protein
LATRQIHALEVEGSSPSPAIMSETLDNTILQNAQNPSKASGDGVSVEQHPLTDQIAADKYLASKQAVRTKGLGIKLIKLSPGGTV